MHKNADLFVINGEIIIRDEIQEVNLFVDIGVPQIIAIESLCKNIRVDVDGLLVGNRLHPVDAHVFVFVFFDVPLRDSDAQIIFDGKVEDVTFVVVVAVLCLFEHFGGDREELVLDFEQSDCFFDGVDDFLEPVRQDDHFLEHRPDER